MSKFDWQFTIPESLLRTQSVLNEIGLANSVLAGSQALRASIPDYNLMEITATALANFALVTENLGDMTRLTQPVLGLTNLLNATQTANMPSVAASVLPLIDPSALAILREASSLAALAQTDWSWIAELPGQEATDEVDPIVENLVTPEIRTEIAADVSEILSTPEQAQQISQSKYVKWEESHPFLAKLLMEVLKELIILGIVSGFKLVIGLPTKDTRVYEAPSSKSSVVVNISVEQNVTIIGDAPYFYEVEFPHPETRESIIGYVYKGNLTPQTAEDSIPSEAGETVLSNAAETSPDSTETAPTLTE